MAKRERDFFRLNRQDQEDLLALLRNNVTILSALRDDYAAIVDRKQAVAGFSRLSDKFRFRLFTKRGF